MRTTLAPALLAAAIAAVAVPAAAQDFLPLAAGPYGAYADDDAPIPPRRVGGYGASETVVTTTRRIYTPPPAVYAEPPTIVTTRRVIAPAPVFEGPVDDIAVGGVRPVDYPFGPPRRVLKSGPDYGPALVRERVISRGFAEPIIVEERRVVTTRRVLGPVRLGWDD
jgi:hypothetical protein